LMIRILNKNLKKKKKKKENNYVGK